MKKSILSLMVLAIAGLGFTGCDDVPMPYNQPNVKPDTLSTDYLNETFASNFGKFTVENVKGTPWTINYNTATATGYSNSTKTTTESESYLISPVVDLSKTTAAYLQFDYIYRYGGRTGAADKVLITDNYTGTPATTSWTDITGTLTEGSDWTTFSTYQRNIPAEFLGKSNVVIALYYACTTSSATWEVKNLFLRDGSISETPGTPDTPDTGEAKGSGTATDPYNAAGANKAASALAADGKTENVYVTGIVSKVTGFNSKFGEINYYISDDGTENGSQFYVYGGLGKDGAQFASQDELKVGQKVTVVGTLINFMGNTPEFQYGSKIVSIDGSGSTPDTPDTPGTSEGVTISGTTVTLTNSSVTAGTETATIDLNALGLTGGDKVSGPYPLSDGSTITVAQGEGKNPPIYHSATKGFRIYAGNTITFNASKPIAKIEFSCDSYNGTDYVGNTTQTITFNGNTATYCNYIAGNSGGTQLRVKKITVTYAK